VSELDDRIRKREQQILADELDARIAAREAELAAQDPSATGNFLSQAGRAVLDNIGQTPDLPGNLLAAGAAGLQGIGGLATGGDFDFMRRFEEEQGKFPASFLLQAPTTNANEMEAFADTFRKEFGRRPVDVEGVENPVPFFTDRFGPSFDVELERINAEQERLGEEFPKSSFFGDIFGEGLSLVGGRAPFARRINAAESALVAKRFTDSMTQPGTRKLFELAMDSGPVRSLMRGTGRSVETGAEAAVLALLNEGDPAETAAYAAGAQAGGSAILGSLKTAGKHPIIASALGFAALIQLSKETVPGGEDNFIDSLQTGFEKVWWSILAGATVTAGGAGRGRGGIISQSWPKIADAFAATPRGTMIALLENYLNASPEEQETVDNVLEQIQRDPEFFGPEITERLSEGFENGNLMEVLREPQ
jgi:hypothetical protein